MHWSDLPAPSPALPLLCRTLKEAMINVVTAVSECNDANETYLYNDQVLQPCPATWYTLEALRMMRMKKRRRRRQRTQKQPQTMLHHHASQPLGKEKRINMYQMGKVGPK